MSSPHDASLPDSHKLIVRGIEAVEGNKHQLHNVEKSLDELKVEVAKVTALNAQTEVALRRLAMAEERRVTEESNAQAQRDAWLSRLWESKPVQYGLILVVIGLSQFFGIRWMTEGSHTSFAVEAPSIEAAP